MQLRGLSGLGVQRVTLRGAALLIVSWMAVWVVAEVISGVLFGDGVDRGRLVAKALFAFVTALGYLAVNWYLSRNAVRRP